MKKFGKALNILLVIIIATTEFPASAKIFNDTKKHWAKGYIDMISGKYSDDAIIIKGASSTTFNPNSNITRADVVVLLGRMEGFDGSSSAAGRFTDVSKGKYYYNYVGWAYSKSIVKGVSNTRFSPESPVTREAFAVMVSNYVTSCSKTVPNNISKKPYADRSGISSWATKQVTKLQNAGLMQGDEKNRFRPKSYLTRAEAATVLSRLYYAALKYRPGSSAAAVFPNVQASISAGEKLYNSMDLLTKFMASDRLDTNLFGAIIGAKALESSWPDASRSLMTFLYNKGGNALTDFRVRAMLMQGNGTNQYQDLLKQLDKFMIAAECYATSSGQNSIAKVEEESVPTKQDQGANWFMAIGIYRVWIAGSAIIKLSSNQYQATVTYNIKDYYDWDPSGGSSPINIAAYSLYELHLAGYARNFHQSGSATMIIKWRSGQLASAEPIDITIYY